MKILEVTAFSAGICGLWMRVLSESKLLAKNHDVYVFSSNIHRSENEKAKQYEVIDKVKIKRFPTFGRFGDNTFFWNYGKQALSLKPDVIICHAYRQYYSTIALKIAKKLNIPCFLVTHAPFLDKKLRNWKLNLIVSLYDNLIGKRILNKYKKIITITKWENQHLFKLGVKKEKIIYIPNGIPEEFFKIKKTKEKKNNILFIGRMTPIKNLETAIKALSKTKDFNLNLLGPIDKPYKQTLIRLIKKLNLNNRVKFFPAVFNIKKKIKIIDENEFFILPSIREGMPQALIEAMAREKLVISSSIDAGKELIQDNQTGFLFETGNSNHLAEILNNIKNMKQNEKNKIKKQARESVKQFSWTNLIKKIEQTIQ